MHKLHPFIPAGETMSFNYLSPSASFDFDAEYAVAKKASELKKYHVTFWICNHLKNSKSAIASPKKKEHLALDLCQ